MRTGDIRGGGRELVVSLQLMDLAYCVQPVTNAVLWVAAVE